MFEEKSWNLYKSPAGAAKLKFRGCELCPCEVELRLHPQAVSFSGKCPFLWGLAKQLHACSCFPWWLSLVGVSQASWGLVVASREEPALCLTTWHSTWLLFPACALFSLPPCCPEVHTFLSVRMQCRAFGPGLPCVWTHSRMDGVSSGSASIHLTMGPPSFCWI